ncbi:HD domain-containing phosphohydrolase [Thiorhodovibrio litoralis]|uniref:HD domain-containing phosphohydrolase n=1 Tax=Thiorhodovibrio litoralis TaxID=2952932 RepID=UPI002B2596AF|nr:HD domain-containing phosphohydrolase [Thiorhodovibrio litoralis]WPL11512.1 Cyclic di-GMP phosphodiesterase response regulator RpfG [Thiorhodovibrio litoralis]
MNTRMLAALAALVVVFAIALAGVFAFAQSERARDMQSLRAQLSIVADSRAQAVEHWLDQQRQLLMDLINNESLQVYLNVVNLQRSGAEATGGDVPDSDANSDPDTDQSGAELTYLRNLLNATARRGGFVARADGEPLPANVRPMGSAGLALLDTQGAVLVSSSGMPPPQGDLEEFVADTPLAENGFFGLERNAQGELIVAWLLPVLTQQDGTGAADVAARLLAVRPVSDDFFAALEQPGETAETAETYLLRKQGQRLEYLSALEDGSAPLSKQLAVGDDSGIDLSAVETPGAFHQGFDYQAAPAFAVSRAISGTPWVLVHLVEQSEALEQSDRRRAMLISVLVTIVIAVAAAILLVWRFATSARVEQAAREYRASAERFESLSRFLDAVSDTQPHAIFATDADNRLTFANKRTAELTGIPKEELPGHTLIGALGQDRGGLYQQLASEALDNQEETMVTHSFDAVDQEGAPEAVWRSYHQPLPAEGEKPAGVLTTIEDLTNLTLERRRRERNTRQLIDTLVGLVDERDPDSAQQSQFVGQVARQVALDMGLDEALVETADQAGRLVNIGKIRVPRAVLTKQGPLTDDERALVRTALDEGPSLLRHLEFDGPVIETLEQINERVDGQGRPRGLAGAEILQTAQVVALANSFVALISPRSFRDGKPFEEAEAELLADADRRFDKKAVLSLLNYLNNKNGRSEWAFMARSHGQEAA